MVNNTAVGGSSDIPELVSYQGDEPENLAQPRISRGSIAGTLSPKENGWIFDEMERGYTDDMPFLWRLSPAADKYISTYWGLIEEKLKHQRPTIVLSLFGFDEMILQNIQSRNVKTDWAMASSETSPLSIVVAQKAKQAGATGIVFTIPNFKYLPYFNWFSKQELDKINTKIKLTRSREGMMALEVLSGDVIFLPTKNVEILFAAAAEGKGFEFPLLDKDVADKDEVIGGSADLVNSRIKVEAKENGFLVVDIAVVSRPQFSRWNGIHINW